MVCVGLPALGGKATRCALPDLATPRLLLRPLRPQQARAVRALLNDPEVGRYLCDGKSVSVAWMQAQITMSVRRFERHGAGLWGVRSRSWRRPLIGIAGVTHLDDAFDPEILFALRPRYWGRGLAREAAEAVVMHLFSHLGWQRLRGATDVPNVSSARLLERLGMEFTGRREGPAGPLVDYELTRARWEQRTPHVRAETVPPE